MNRLLAVLLALSLSSCEVLQEYLKESSNSNTFNFLEVDLWNNFNQKGPISTTFKDAVYEAEGLSDFEPDENEYLPIDVQPKCNEGGYLLRSGLYTMNAKSFCLRGYTHGPSKGDGHLYAPLKGKKSDLVRAIIERYEEKPTIPQQNIQVLLWAIISGADLNKLGEQHQNTLNQLFSIQELLTFQGKDLLRGFTANQLNELKGLALKNTSPKVRNFLEADKQIRSLIQQNRSFQEIERIAIIAGIAPPEDMIREVSKGRWSYHPQGFFVRFFPSGYTQTRVDVYVPYEGDLSFDSSKNPKVIQNDNPLEKEVVFNPATMVATPANQSSQRIGISGVPMESDDTYHITFYAYGAGKEFKDREGNVLHKSQTGHIFVGFYKNGKRQRIKGFSPTVNDLFYRSEVNNWTDESKLFRYHDEKFVRQVSRREYYDAWFITKETWFPLFNDCVSYADDIADVIGLNTPLLVTDPLDFSYPLWYLQYLKRNNTSYRPRDTN